MSYDFSSLESKFTKVLDHVLGELSLLRTGKASPQLLDSVVVEAYGTRMKIAELATISAPDTTLLLITPWDRSVIEAIEKAIASAHLNLNPVVDGQIIRIAVPPLTEERRLEMVKVLHTKVEDGRKMLRTIRGEEKRSIEQLEKDGGYSEDDIKSYVDQLESKMKDYLAKLDEIAARKEVELMKV
jgi:ribosome recycling factor